MPDPIYGDNSTFEQGNSNDPISGIQETPLNEFAHQTTIATATKLGHVKGGGNVTIDADGEMNVEVPDVDLSAYQQTNEKDTIGGYPGLEAETGKIAQEWLPVISKIRRHDYVGTTSYCGTAPAGTLDSAPIWTLTKIVVQADGTTTTAHATDRWDNHLTAQYLWEQYGE